MNLLQEVNNLKRDGWRFRYYWRNGVRIFGSKETDDIMYSPLELLRKKNIHLSNIKRHNDIRYSDDLKNAFEYIQIDNAIREEIKHSLGIKKDDEMIIIFFLKYFEDDPIGSMFKTNFGDDFFESKIVVWGILNGIKFPRDYNWSEKFVNYMEVDYKLFKHNADSLKINPFIDEDNSFHINENTNILDLLMDSNLANSKSEARRFIKNKGIYLNNVQIQDDKKEIGINDLIDNKYLFVSHGKKKHKIGIYQ